MGKAFVIFSTADWKEPYWTNKQHTASILHKLGYRVLFVESFGIRVPKLNSAKDWSRILVRLRGFICLLLLGPYKAADQLYILPVACIPGLNDSRIINLMNHYILALQIKRSLNSIKGERKILWTYHPCMMRLIDVVKPERIVYHCVDDLSAVPGVDSERIKILENQLIKRADICFVTSKALQERCKRLNSNSYFYSNVVDYEHFDLERYAQAEKPNEYKGMKGPIAIYHGVLSDFKVDLELVYEMSKIRLDINYVLIGEEREGQSSRIVKKLRSCKNVYLLGYRKYQEIPYYLSFADVGILPLLMNEYTYSMFPMKYYEFIAARLPVVSTPVHFLKTLGNLQTYARTPEQFVAAVALLAKRGKLTKSKSRQLIGYNTWTDRMKAMLQVIDELEDNVISNE